MKKSTLGYHPATTEDLRAKGETSKARAVIKRTRREALYLFLWLLWPLKTFKEAWVLEPCKHLLEFGHSTAAAQPQNACHKNSCCKTWSQSRYTCLQLTFSYTVKVLRASQVFQGLAEPLLGKRPHQPLQMAVMGQRGGRKQSTDSIENTSSCPFPPYTGVTSEFSAIFVLKMAHAIAWCLNKLVMQNAPQFYIIYVISSKCRIWASVVAVHIINDQDNKPVMRC